MILFFIFWWQRYPGGSSLVAKVFGGKLPFSPIIQAFHLLLLLQPKKL